MSIKTEISSIRRELQNDKIRPVAALNSVTELFSNVVKQLPSDSIGALVSDLWSEWYGLAKSNTIRNNNAGHAHLAFDAKIQIIGNLIIRLEKAIKKEIK